MKKLILTLFFGTAILYAQDTALTIMKQNGCLNCHAIDSRKNAPAFAGIGKRNKRFEGDNAKNVIINTIKNGSKGKYPRFSNIAMPAYSNLSQTELNTLADFILAQSSKAKGHKGGCMHKQGNFQGRGMRRN
jgi:cytochrome c